MAIALLGLITLGYLVLFWTLSGMPYLDLPNHMTRCYVIEQLLSGNGHGGAGYENLFTFDLRFTPYFLSDMIVVSLMRVLSLETAALCWVSLSFLFFPVSVWLYLRTVGISRRSFVPVLCCAVFLSGDWFFLSGFYSYRVGVSLLFLCFAVWNLFTSNKQGSNLRQTAFFLLFCIGATGCYLTHLSSLVFLGVILGTSIILKWNSAGFMRKYALLSLAPLVIIGGVHAAQAGLHQSYAGPWVFRTLEKKVLGFGTMFIRFDYTIDIFLFVVFLFIIGGLLVSNEEFRKTRKLGSQNREFLVLSSMLFLFYLVFPVAVSSIYDIDNRALPIAFLFLLFAPCSFSERSSHPDKKQRSIIFNTFSLLLPLLNLIYLIHYLPPHNAFAEKYIEAIKHIPENKVVLPIATREQQGRFQTGLHNGSLYTAYKKGLTPYLFSSLIGEPITHFHYREKLYAPNIYWYLRDFGIDWEKVLETYDFIIITKPYDRIRVSVEGFEEVFSNEAAAVYKINS